jgi:hypothetical protein
MTHIIKLTDITDNSTVHIVADKILYIKLSPNSNGTIVVVGPVTITVKEPIPLIMALLENRDTLAARILYDKPKEK